MKDINLIQGESEQNQSEGGNLQKKGLFIAQIFDPVEYHDPEDQAALEEAHKNALQYASAYNRQVAIDLGVSVPVNAPCFVLPGEPQRELINPIEYYGESPCVPEETPVQSHEIPLSLRSKFISPCHPEEPAPAPVAAPAATPEPVPAPVAVPAATPEPTPAPVAVPAATPEPTPAPAPVAAPAATFAPAAFLRKSANKSKKVTCYYLVNRLKSRYILKVFGQEVYMYVGTHYQRSDRQSIARTVMEICTAEIQESGSIAALKQVYDALLFDPTIAVPNADTEERYLPFLDGILDLSNGNFLPHTPDIFRTYVINARYQSDTACMMPVAMESFLYWAMGGDRGLMERVYQILGYMLTPDIQAKAAFVFQGVPNSGKSVLSDWLTRLFPPELSSRLSVHDLSRPFSLGEIADRSLWISPDLPAKPLSHAAVAAIKQITGRDAVTVDIKYSAHRTFRSTAKLLMVSNYPLLTQLYDDAFYARIVAVPFRFAPEPSEIDRDLLEKLYDERDAIVHKCIDRYFKLRSNNYQFSGNYKLNEAPELSQYTLAPDETNTAEYAVYGFLTECCIEGSSFLFLEDAYELFLDWYGGHNISRNKFSTVFYRFAEELYHAKKARSRRTPSSNPQFGVSGIELR